MEINASRIKISGRKVTITNINRGGIIVFGQDWCPHCRENKPIFREAYILSKDIHPEGMLYVEGTKNKALFENLESNGIIKGYPSIYLFNSQGTLTKIYSGPRTPEGYLKTLSKQL